MALKNSGSKKLLVGVKSLLASGKYSDLTINSRGRKWAVHKAVLSSQSDFFAKACDSGFKEAKENTIDLSVDEPDVVSMLLHYMYHFELDNQPGITDIVKVYTIADKYFVDSLKADAKKWFEKNFADLWDSQVFAAAARDAYTLEAASVGAIRGILAAIAAKHTKEFAADETKYRHYWEAAEELPCFAADVLRESVRTQTPAAKEEGEEESDEDMGFGLFD